MSAFAFLVGLGASLGLWRVVQRVPRWQAVRWLNAALLSLAFSLLGARLDYVAFHGAYFSQHPLEALLIYKGGLNWTGAMLGGLIGLILAALIWKLPTLLLADNLTPLAAPLAIGVWLGCWLAGCAYGAAIPEGAWWGLPCRDESGAIAMRIPVQTLAALTLVGYFAWLEIHRFPRATPGRYACLAWLGLNVNLLIFNLLRADPALLWNGLRADVWIAAGLCLLSLLACWLVFRPRKLTSTEPS